jgi:4-hydroxy-2-oxoheptanedioate aldolase
MSMDMVPMMIKQGFRLIAVTFDVWGLANLVAGNMKQGREHAEAVAKEMEAQSDGKTT